MVRDATRGNPRKLLETLGQIIEYAVANNEPAVDLSLVGPLLGDDYQDTTDDEADRDDNFENEERWRELSGARADPGNRAVGPTTGLTPAAPGGGVGMVTA
jgi:hypothetical protein